MTTKRRKHETHLVEWKESWRDEYLKWLCGFANAEGGTLVIGVSDKGEPVGAPDAAACWSSCRTRSATRSVSWCRRARSPRRARRSSRSTLRRHCRPSATRASYHFRSGSTKQQLTGNALSTFLLRKFGRTWDGSPVPNLAVRSLSAEAFKRFKAHARVGKRMPQGSLSAKRADLIEKLLLIEGGMLKRAALLLFHGAPERWVTGAWVKIGMFRGGADLAYHDEVHGDLFTQFDQTLELLLTKYMVAWISYRGMARVETFPVPREALREAVLNALIHKDYSSGTPIQIRVQPDSLWIWNAGPLPPSWTAQTLLERHTSQPHNPDIANTFFRAGLIEAWGRGYERIVEACREAGTPEPTVEYDGNGIWLKWAWVNPTKDSEPIRPQVESEVESRLLRALTEGPCSKAELARAIGQDKPSGHVHLAVRRLVEEGAAELTLPDKPNSRLQKYRLTPAGRARLTATEKGRK